MKYAPTMRTAAAARSAALSFLLANTIIYRSAKAVLSAMKNLIAGERRESV